MTRTAVTAAAAAAPVVGHVRGNAIFRTVLILLPALFCSWTALRISLALTVNTNMMMTHLLTSDVQDLDARMESANGVRMSNNNISSEAQLWINRNKEQYQKSQNCFVHNSLEWLEKPRHGNLETLSFLEEDVLAHDATLPSIARILRQQSLCSEKSSFASLLRPVTVHQWTARLLFLIVHLHQHSPALTEARIRNRPNCQQPKRKYQIGEYDYECPNAKFLVISFYRNGIGANVRLAAVPALMAGLATDRVVLFVDNAPTGPTFLRESWMLASCQRKDAQCYFRPMSPCVLRHDEFEDAPVLSKSMTRQIFRHGTLPKEYSKERVVILHLTYRPQRQPDNLRAILYNKTRALVERIVGNSNLIDPQTAAIIYNASNVILEEEEEDTAVPPTQEFQYYGGHSILFQSLLLYAIRPNPQFMARIDNVMKAVIPSDFVSDEVLGLPIRASDKCDVESECLTFAQYMAAVESVWTDVHNDGSGVNNIPTNRTTISVVVTTESKQIQQEQQEYAKWMFDSQNFSFPQLRNSLFRPRFVLNHQDVTQDTGYLKEVFTLGAHGTNSTMKHPNLQLQADEIMLSTLSSLQMQLQTSLTVGNCCSNFHLLLKDLLAAGCGSSPHGNYFQCLQDHKTKEYQICCSWDKSSRCRKKNT